MIFKLNFFKSLKLVKVLIKSIYSMIVYFLGSMLIIYLGADICLKIILYFCQTIRSITILK